MENETKAQKMEVLPIKQLVNDPDHVRQDIGDLKSLISSLRKDGQLVPINVNKSEAGSLYVNDGLRRIEALKQMGQETILAIVREGHTPEDAAHESFMINSKRKGLNPMEEARHINKMHTKFALSYRNLEIKGYGSAAQLSRKATLVDLPEEVQTHLVNEKLSTAHGLALLDLPTGEEKINMAKRCIDHGWSAKNLEKGILRYNQESKRPVEKKVSILSTEIPGVYNKDARDMSEQPDESVHLTFTSAPYFLGKEYEQGYSFDEHWDNIEGVLKESARVTVHGGIIALNVNDMYNFKGKKGDDKKSHIELVGQRYQQIMKRLGFQLESQIIWVKGIKAYAMDWSKAFSSNTAHTTYRSINCHDFIYIFRNKGDRQIPTGPEALSSALTKEEWAKYMPSVWEISPVAKNDGHPTIFPDELARRIIKMFSFVGEKVLDPFLGSGTTVKVARELGREGIGYEREAKYMETIMKKLGVEVPAITEGVAEFAKRNLEELEANQPGKPEVEVIASEGMLEKAEAITSEQELATAAA